MRKFFRCLLNEYFYGVWNDCCHAWTFSWHGPWRFYCRLCGQKKDRVKRTWDEKGVSQ